VQLRSGGTLIITNLDPAALNYLNRIRSWARVIYNGLACYRVRPPKGLGQHLLTEERLWGLLRKSAFKVIDQETISDTSRSSNIPVEYIRAVKIWAARNRYRSFDCAAGANSQAAPLRAVI
jgi:hypothetical protein